MMCAARARCYVRRMRVKRPVLDTALDAGFAVLGFGLTAMATWTSTSLTGTPLTGPPWLLAVLPVLIGGPLLLRRRAPLLMWVMVWVGISLQALATHATLGRAVAGLAVAVPGLTIVTMASHQSALGMVTLRTLFGGQLHGGTWSLAG